MTNFAKYFCFFFLITLCSYAFATDHSESWNTAIITGSLSKDKTVKYYIQPELGFEDDKYKYRSTNLFLGIGRLTSPNVIIWLMNGWLNRLKPDGDFNNIDTIRQQLDWHAIPSGRVMLTCISRLEERKKYAEPQWAIRFRERMIVRVPFQEWENHSFVAFNEIFLNLNNPAWINNNSILGQNHAFIGIGTQLSKYLSFDLGYLNQFQMKTTGNKDNNVLYLVFNVALS